MILQKEGDYHLSLKIFSFLYFIAAKTEVIINSEFIFWSAALPKFFCLSSDK